MPYNDFMKGSALGTSYFLKAGRPIDSKTIAGTLNDVYSLDENYRFEGLVIFVIDKGKFYYFRDGVTDDCLKPVESGSVTFLDYNELNNYSIGDYVLHDCKLYECKQDNTTGTWNENLWKLLIGSDGIKFEDFNETKDYFIGDLVLHDHKLYKCITDSTADIWSNSENNFELVIGFIEDEFIKIKEVYDDTHTYNTDEYVIHAKGVYKAKEDGITGTWDETKFDLIIGGGDAESIAYTNTELPPTIDNVKLTLDEIIHKLYYVAPEITSFTTTPSKLVYEVGETVPEVVFNWTYNKDITTQTLTDCTLIDETDRTSTYSTPITTNKTFTLECSDGENTATKSIEFKFVYSTYIGVVDNGNVDETNIVANCTKLTQDKTNITQKFTASFKTIVIATPKVFGELKSITNANKYEVLNSFTKQELTINGIDYYVYSLEDVYITDFEYAFKF